MKNSISTIIITLLIFFAAQLKAQQDYPTDYFRSPVDFRIILSGTFGELRSGHFHSGIDIKTGGVEGKNIYAVADGYISRIKVSATGFGKALYIAHPNGFVSVYGHLRGFNETIATYVKDKHYEYESFELDLFPAKDEFLVKKGEVVAFSGNTGGSGGPHLHFEMRLASTQTPVNPLLFGYEVKDYIRPTITGLKVIPVNSESTIDGNQEAKIFVVEGWGEEHRIKNHDTITVSGPFSLAINTIDKLNDANNKNGVYTITLNVDGSTVFYMDVEKFDFSESRYINSYIDYAEYIDSRRRYQRSEVDPNNRLSIYGNVENHGIINFDDTDIHHLEYVVEDFQGNVSRLPIIVKSNPEKVAPKIEEGILFSIDKKNEFSAPNISVTVPGSCLYRDMYFVYDTLPMSQNDFSRVHRVHNNQTPVQKYFDLAIIPDSIPQNTDKLLIARLTKKGSRISYGGKWDNDRMVGRVRSFGDYVIAMDTTSPSINSVNISSGEIKPDRKTVKVKIKDDLSGIKKFRATINGNWLLMEYDAKNALLIYNIDERLQKGENKFVLEVSDMRDNKAVFEKTLIRK